MLMYVCVVMYTHRNKNIRATRKSVVFLLAFCLWWRLSRCCEKCGVFMCFPCPYDHSLVRSIANSLGIWAKCVFRVVETTKVHSRHPSFRIRKMGLFAFYHSARASFPSGQLAESFASDFIYTSVLHYTCLRPKGYIYACAARYRRV